MQISEHTQGLAERFREAKDAWLNLDVRNATRRESERIQLTFQLAAEALAAALLADIDEAKEAR